MGYRFAPSRTIFLIHLRIFVKRLVMFPIRFRAERYSLSGMSLLFYRDQFKHPVVSQDVNISRFETGGGVST